MEDDLQQRVIFPLTTRYSTGDDSSSDPAVNGEAKGVGISAQKNAAKELAAKEALANLGLTVG